MRILVPVMERNENPKICEQFGRAPYFAIIKDRKLVEIVENPGHSLSKGAGSKAAQFALEKGVKKIIVKKEIGPHAKEVLEGEVEIEVNPNVEYLSDILK